MGNVQRARHVAIIMDGNGRWAGKRGLPRFAGHRAGADNVDPIVQEAARLGLSQLTLYSFSMENWKRPAEEVRLLMDLYVEYLGQYRPKLMAHGIRFRQIGRREGLSPAVLDALDEMTAVTAGNEGMTLCLAINYGSRAEIVDATRLLAQRVARGEIQPEQIDERMVSESLYTTGMPDPDLLVRTAGEMRLSNYLLWQISYAELYVSEVYWPDFTCAHFHQALESFARRDRRFGGLREW